MLLIATLALLSIFCFCALRALGRQDREIRRLSEAVNKKVQAQPLSWGHVSFEKPHLMPDPFRIVDLPPRTGPSPQDVANQINFNRALSDRMDGIVRMREAQRQQKEDSERDIESLLREAEET